MTNSWTDIGNTDLVWIMGGNAAEAHPCGFKWVTEAKANRAAKLMVVDDAWATIGSCNLHRPSLYGNAEMNASIWDAAFARELRCALLSEHLATETATLDAREALRLYRRIARGNRARRDAGSTDWPGLAFTLDPETYGA